jgi:Ca-activated chloride channel family protein
MKRTFVGGGSLLFLSASIAIATLVTLPSQAPARSDPAPGQLAIPDPRTGAVTFCPLKGTKVNAEITGFGARVTLVQTFANPSKEPIEAIYAFPLPENAAVDRMRIRIQNRIIEGQIKRREEARTIYEQAKAAGQTAALLDQERPNLFTQSIANIVPGAQVEVEISYVQLLKFEEGQFEFVFPMVVGPRYIGHTVSDGEKIAPPITPKGTRTGADIELTVRLDAGARITSLQSELHEITSQLINDQQAIVRLAKKDEIPNRDFILRYGVATDTVSHATLTTVHPRLGGFFSLVLMPPKTLRQQLVAPKEVLFIMDQTGSQAGFPIKKSIELTLKLIESLNPSDTFNVMGFNTSQALLWETPRQATPDNLAEARKFITAMEAQGGTDILGAVNRAFGMPEDPDRLRLIVFNTDGYVGNEFEILDAIQKHRGNTRMFTFGIGNSVNRFLVEAMSAEGKGACEIITLESDANAALERFIQRTANPVLTEIEVSFEGLAVEDVLPKQIPDVFSESPVVIEGRYTAPGQGYVVLRGKLGGKIYTQRIPIELPVTTRYGSAIASLWAREKVEDLMRSDWLTLLARRTGEQGANTTQEQITNLGLQFGLMTQFTSFVAVEQRVVNVGGKQRKVKVPVDMADGVSYEGIFGRDEERSDKKPTSVSGGAGFGGSGGSGRRAGEAQSAPGAASRAAKETLSLGQDLSNSPAERSFDRTAAKMSATERKKALLESKLDSRLKAVRSGKVEVQVRVSSVAPKDLARLKKLGFSIASVEKDLLVVIGTCDAKALPELVMLEFVLRVQPLEE